ncbi:HTH-type transcriptional regulator BetI [Corynebacterium diphtheriae]|nr:HTH-type transcriptional regulator BetI [Corynebacterium diphtheriae]
MASLREKKIATKKALAHATASLVVEAGLDAATVSAIAQRAGVSQRTFHNYFNSREEALVTFTFECITALIDDMTLLPDDWSLYRKTEAVVLKHLEKMKQTPCLSIQFLRSANTCTPTRPKLSWP